MRKQIICALLLTVFCSVFFGCFGPSQNTGSKCAEILDAYFASQIHLNHQKLQATKLDLSSAMGYGKSGLGYREKARFNINSRVKSTVFQTVKLPVAYPKKGKASILSMR